MRGLHMKVREVMGQGNKRQWLWLLRYFNKTVGEGVSDTEDGATKALTWATGEFVRGSKGKGDSNLARLKLRELVKKRPYLVMGVVESLLNPGIGLGDIMKDAKEAEFSWWESDKGSPFRKDLSTHHLTLAPHVAAMKLYDAFVTCGYIVEPTDEDGVRDVRGLKKWASKNLGPDFGQEQTAEEKLFMEAVMKKVMRDVKGKGKVA